MAATKVYDTFTQSLTRSIRHNHQKCPWPLQKFMTLLHHHAQAQHPTASHVRMPFNNIRKSIHGRCTSPSYLYITMLTCSIRQEPSSVASKSFQKQAKLQHTTKRQRAQEQPKNNPQNQTTRQHKRALRARWRTCYMYAARVSEHTAACEMLLNSHMNLMKNLLMTRPC